MVVSVARDVEATGAALEGWLSDRVGAPVQVGDISVPGLSGFSNETLIFDARWDVDGRSVTRGLVIRVEPSSHQVFPSSQLDAQVRVLRAVAAAGSVPVPEVLWFEEDPSLLGDRFVVMARVDGDVPADNPSYHAEGWLSERDETAQAAVWNSGLDAMAAIHRLDHASTDLSWITPREPAHQLELDREYRAFVIGDRSLPVADRALEVLSATVPPAVAVPAVCWGDSRIGNMIFAVDGSVAAVLDWEMVTAGDPVQDLAWYLLIDRHHHEAFGVPRLSGLPDRVTSIERWERAAGRSADHLGWYELLGALRYALVVSRVIELLDETGVLPGGAAMALDHPGTQLLGRLLEERT